VGLIRSIGRSLRSVGRSYERKILRPAIRGAVGFSTQMLGARLGMGSVPPGMATILPSSSSGGFDFGSFIPKDLSFLEDGGGGGGGDQVPPGQSGGGAVPAVIAGAAAVAPILARISIRIGRRVGLGSALAILRKYGLAAGGTLLGIQTIDALRLWLAGTQKKRRTRGIPARDVKTVRKAVRIVMRAKRIASTFPSVSGAGPRRARRHRAGCGCVVCKRVA